MSPNNALPPSLPCTRDNTLLADTLLKELKHQNPSPDPLHSFTVTLTTVPNQQPVQHTPSLSSYYRYTVICHTRYYTYCYFAPCYTLLHPATPCFTLLHPATSYTLLPHAPEHNYQSGEL
ncbi:hypothetical protein E2C01_075164 [Portunus trituberculatus]|uniref:Uncharacterized protein n=1 Tax=Portunus trituberculatus TaxID=210409 RepID=A0A5B7I5E9_PORTR|nr:hypothetical protein [Portunus trituberculatus]